MTCADIYKYIRQIETENADLKARMEELSDIGQYRGVAISIGVACKLIGVTPKTMRGYIAIGLLSRMPESTSNNTYLDAYEVLRVGRDKKGLRRRARVIVEDGHKTAAK